MMNQRAHNSQPPPRNQNLKRNRDRETGTSLIKILPILILVIVLSMIFPILNKVLRFKLEATLFVLSEQSPQFKVDNEEASS